MRDEFQPIVRNPHLLTIAANYWSRKIDEERFPPTPQEYRTEEGVTVLAIEHQPLGPPRGQVIVLHGLEGSASAGYIQSFAQAALTRGFGVHRLNMRSCGGTEELCETMYHSGLTSDIHLVLQRIRDRRIGPLFLLGFSLGGNVALKLAGELGETNLVAGVCTVSTPIDLAACVRCIDKRSNTLYASRFLRRLKDRIRRMSKLSRRYNVAGLKQVRTIWEFDDRFTAPLFGFGTAENYYATQSAIRYVNSIRVPALLISAQDDPLVPFELYHHPTIASNPALTLIAPKHGGHLGFLSRHKPRFWVDGVVLNWMGNMLASTSRAVEPLTAVSQR